MQPLQKMGAAEEQIEHLRANGELSPGWHDLSEFNEHGSLQAPCRMLECSSSRRRRQASRYKRDDNPTGFTFPSHLVKADTAKVGVPADRTWPDRWVCGAPGSQQAAPGSRGARRMCALGRNRINSANWTRRIYIIIQLFVGQSGAARYIFQHLSPRSQLARNSRAPGAKFASRPKQTGLVTLRVNLPSPLAGGNRRPLKGSKLIRVVYCYCAMLLRYFWPPAGRLLIGRLAETAAEI